MEAGGGGPRPRSLFNENVDSQNVRDFLRGNEDGVTVGAILREKRPPVATLSNRTLLDIIRDDPSGSSPHSNRNTWQTFKDKLRLRRAGAAWTSSVPIPASDVPIPSANRMMLRRQSTRFPSNAVAENSGDLDPESTHSDQTSSSTTGEGINQAGLRSMPSNRAMMMRHNSSRLPSLPNTSDGQETEFTTSFNTARNIVQLADQNREEEEENEEEEERGLSEEYGEGGEPQVRMSLMALLAETDRQMGIDGSLFIMDDDDDDDEDEEGDKSSGVGEYNNCCVCMVRHKGAAFIPCGHTFCRLCSRELWVQRGSCPLCNNFILEILDIF